MAPVFDFQFSAFLKSSTWQELDTDQDHQHDVVVEDVDVSTNVSLTSQTFYHVIFYCLLME
ncbi:hypothetical protein ACF0H5_021693 [Mactra antiquata]